jgi:peptidoglycan/xylan/chitin deacetylase (PgdA/CDA1 family)
MLDSIRKLFANVLYYSGITRLFYGLGNNKVMILAYHRVLDLSSDFEYDGSNVSVSVDNFSKQMKFLFENYNVISLDQFVKNFHNDISLPKNSVIITFDDGYVDSYRNAYPILKKFNLPATIYLTANYIGSDKLFWWDLLSYMLKRTKVNSLEIEKLGIVSLRNKSKAYNRIKSMLKSVDDAKKDTIILELSQKLGVKIPKRNMFMDWQQAKIMSRNDISFGAHTCNHPILTNISLKSARSEISLSKSIVEKRLGKNVCSFAYPNGHKEDYNAKIISILKGQGFESAVTYIPGWVGNRSDLFSLNRVFVRYSDDMIIFKNKLTGMDIYFGKIYYFFNGLRGKRR